MVGVARFLIGVLGLVLISALAVGIGVGVAERTHWRDQPGRSLWQSGDGASFIVPASRSYARPCSVAGGEPECSRYSSTTSSRAAGGRHQDHFGMGPPRTDGNVEIPLAKRSQHGECQ